MVSIGLSDEQVALRASVREFATAVIAPQMSELYEKSVFPVEIVRQMGRMGLFGLPFPEEVGGMGGDLTALGIAIEELARVDSSVAITLEAAVGLGAMPLHRFGSAELKGRWLPQLMRGEALGASGSPRRVVARTRARPGRPLGSTTTARPGPSTAARRSSPTAAPSSPRSSSSRP
jgi:alkylation response protein AidB-like acyl-CoA dehydrogenase